MQRHSTVRNEPIEISFLFKVVLNNAVQAIENANAFRFIIDTAKKIYLKEAEYSAKKNESLKDNAIKAVDLLEKVHLETIKATVDAKLIIEKHVQRLQVEIPSCEVINQISEAVEKANLMQLFQVDNVHAIFLKAEIRAAQEAMNKTLAEKKYAELIKLNEGLKELKLKLKKLYALQSVEAKPAEVMEEKIEKEEKKRAVQQVPPRQQQATLYQPGGGDLTIFKKGLPIAPTSGVEHPSSDRSLLAAPGV